MHLFYSLAFLIATIALLAVYGIAGYLIVVALQRGIRRLRYGAATGGTPVKGRKWPFFSSKAYTKIVLLTSVILIAVYANQRIEWMGKDNAHLDAKEYWVSGQVIASLRLAGTLVLHPENPLLWPYNFLQEVVYDKGIQYLPKEDGELGVWTDAWFIYPYNRRGLLPKVKVKTDKWFHLIDPVFTAKETFPKIIAMLDRTWFAIQTMATKPYADKKMKVDNYYRNFPRTVMYYHVYESFYVPWQQGMFKKMMADPRYVPRNEHLVEWLDKIKKEWEASGFYSTMWERYPIVGASQAAVRLSVLQNLMKVLVLRKEFRCEHPLVDKVYKGFLELMSDDYTTNLLLRYQQIDKKQAAILYKDTLYSPAGQICQRMLERYCLREFPKEKLLLITQAQYDGRWSERAVDRFIRSDLDFSEGGE